MTRKVKSCEKARPPKGTMSLINDNEKCGHEASLHQLKTKNDQDKRAAWPLAHKLKAASYALSAEEMAALSHQLERAASQEDWVEAQKVYAGLTLAFSHVREFLDNKLSESAGAYEQLCYWPQRKSQRLKSGTRKGSRLWARHCARNRAGKHPRGL